MNKEYVPIMQHHTAHIHTYKSNNKSSNFDEESLQDVAIDVLVEAPSIKTPENERRGGFIFNLEISAFFILLLWCTGIILLIYLYYQGINVY